MTTLCTADDSVLIVVDAQSRLLKAMPDAEQTVSNIQRLCQAAQLLDIPVMVTEQYPQGLGHTDEAILATLGDNIKSNKVKPISKTGFSCCAAKTFNESLSENARRQVILCGMEAHVCVLQTAMQIAEQGMQIFVIEDAVCSRKEMHKQNALDRLRQHGVIISNVESVLFEWMRDATHPQFKAISALIR